MNSLSIITYFLSIEYIYIYLFSYRNSSIHSNVPVLVFEKTFFVILSHFTHCIWELREGWVNNFFDYVYLNFSILWKLELLQLKFIHTMIIRINLLQLIKLSVILGSLFLCRLINFNIYDIILFLFEIGNMNNFLLIPLIVSNFYLINHYFFSISSKISISFILIFLL